MSAEHPAASSYHSWRACLVRLRVYLAKRNPYPEEEWAWGEVGRTPSAAQGRDARATFELTDGDLALIYVYVPGRTGTAPGESKRQLTQPCQAIFDYAEDGTMLGVEVIVKVPDA